MLFKGGFWLCFLLLQLGVQSREIPNEELDEVEVDLRGNGEEITPEEPENEMESKPEGSTETWMNQMKLWLEEKLKEVVENVSKFFSVKKTIPLNLRRNISFRNRRKRKPRKSTSAPTLIKEGLEGMSKAS